MWKVLLAACSLRTLTLTGPVLSPNPPTTSRKGTTVLHTAPCTPTSHCCLVNVLPGTESQSTWEPGKPACCARNVAQTGWYVVLCKPLRDEAIILEPDGETEAHREPEVPQRQGACPSDLCTPTVTWMEGRSLRRPGEQSPPPSACPSPIVAECSLPDTVPTLLRMSEFNSYHHLMKRLLPFRLTNEKTRAQRGSVPCPRAHSPQGWTWG